MNGGMNDGMNETNKRKMHNISDLGLETARAEEIST
jgi:hypothetical protein